MKIIYKTTLTVTVLSEEALTDANMERIAYECDEGAYLGASAIVGVEEVEGEEAIEAASKEVGNDGSFFAYLWEDDDDGDKDDAS